MEILEQILTVIIIICLPLLFYFVYELICDWAKHDKDS